MCARPIDVRRVQSALLDRIWTVTFGAISFKMTLIAVEVVEVIEKMIKLASHPIVAMQVLTRLGSAGQVGLGFEAFCGPICHRHDVHFADRAPVRRQRSDEHTSELQSLMRISYAVFCLKKKTQKQH